MRSNFGDRRGLADTGGDVMDVVKINHDYPTIWLRMHTTFLPSELCRLSGSLVGDDLVADDGTNLRGRYLCAGLDIGPTDDGGEYVGFMVFWPEDGIRVLFGYSPGGLLGAQAIQVYQRKDFRPILDPIRVVAGAM